MSVRLDQRMVAKTAAYTVNPLVDRCGTVFTNRGAVGAVTFTLPTIQTGQYIGLWYEFHEVAAQNVVVASPVADTLIVPGDLDADSLTSAAVGGRIKAQWDGTSWLAGGVFVGGTYTPID